MSRPSPNSKPTVWDQATFVERADACRALLAIHGFMTQAESAKVRERINKWVIKSMAPEGATP